MANVSHCSQAAEIEGCLPVKLYCRLFFNIFPFPPTTAKFKCDRFLAQNAMCGELFDTLCLLAQNASLRVAYLLIHKSPITVIQLY